MSDLPTRKKNGNGNRNGSRKISLDNSPAARSARMQAGLDKARERRMREVAELYLARPLTESVKKFYTRVEVSPGTWFRWQGQCQWFRELLQSYDAIRVSGVGLDVLRHQIQGVNATLARDAQRAPRASERTAAARVIHEALRTIPGAGVQVNTQFNAGLEGETLEELLRQRAELAAMLAQDDDSTPEPT